MNLVWRVVQGLLAVMAIAVLAFLGRCVYIDNAVFNDKKRRAEAFCARFAVGTSMDEVRAAAEALTDTDDRHIDSDRVLVAYKPPTMLLQHQCVVEGENGRVVRATYSLLD